MNQINLQHGTTTVRGEQEEWKTKESRRRNGRLWWGRFAEKESFKPGVKERRGDG